MCAELTPAQRKNIEAARTVSSSQKRSDKIESDHLRKEISKVEKTLQAYRQARETPELGISSNSGTADNPGTAKFKFWDCGHEGAASELGADSPSKGADNLKPDQPVEMACIWAFFGLLEKQGYADLFQAFLDSKYSDDQSKYLEQLRQFKDYMEQLVEEDADTANEGVNSDRSCVTTGCRNCFAPPCCHCDSKETQDFLIDMEDELPNSEDYESCRATVKFRVLFFTAIIAAAQAVYTILSYLESQDDIDMVILHFPLHSWCSESKQLASSHATQYQTLQRQSTSC
jgi:hypothetical protein